ncbi:MAG TPA: DUF1329 domain-containing protein [Candidatus Binatia bacterium]|nr:DUF1329 domain-containing protein [Candidatus Binatia bacterium]
MVYKRGRQRGTSLSVLLVLLAFASPVQADTAQGADLKEKILAEFYPYRQGGPQVEGITPGMTISKDNAQVAAAVLPPEVLKVIQTGDLQITVQATTDVPLREEYINATVEHAAQVALGPDGTLSHYVAGLPFPLIDPADPQAGLKMGWNLRYRERADIVQSWGTTSLLNSSGGVERSSTSLYVRMYGMYRPNPEHNVAEWAEDGVLFKDYSITLRPTDVEGVQSMGIRYNQDDKEDDRWIYDPKTRRTRKIVYNPYDASQGLTFLSEEFSGFEGHVYAYDWHFVEEKVVLAPGVVRAEAARLGGTCNCYPVDPWELRWVRVVDLVPRVANHPYGRRRLYVDRQHGSPLFSVIFDKEGQHWRTFFFSFAHPDSSTLNRGLRVPMYAGNSWVDYKAGRATVWVPSKNIYNRPLPAQFFSVASMMRQGK